MAFVDLLGLEQSATELVDSSVFHATGTANPFERDGIQSVVGEEMAYAAMQRPLADVIQWKKIAYEAAGGYTPVAAVSAERCAEYLLVRVGRKENIGERHV